MSHVAARLVGLERPAAGFAGFEGGQTAASNAVKNTWLGHVAARVVASCLGKACGSVLNALENRRLRHVAAKVVALDGSVG